MRRQGAWREERGFTLWELIIVITIMGIVFAIASSSWFGAVESRRVDSATNQLAADLREAHSRAINRLADQTVTLNTNQSEYTMPGGVAEDLDDNRSTGSAGDVVSVDAPYTIVFKGDGSAQFVNGTNPITVRATNNTGNFNRININLVTSRIKIDP